MSWRNLVAPVHLITSNIYLVVHVVVRLGLSFLPFHTAEVSDHCVRSRALLLLKGLHHHGCLPLEVCLALPLGLLFSFHGYLEHLFLYSNLLLLLTLQLQLPLFHSFHFSFMLLSSLLHFYLHFLLLLSEFPLHLFLQSATDLFTSTFFFFELPLAVTHSLLPLMLSLFKFMWIYVTFLFHSL
jgi:hypothetical protein